MSTGRIFVRGWGLVVALVAAAGAGLASPRQSAPVAAKPSGKIGIFDLDAIHATELKPQVVARSVSEGIVTEAVRFTSVPGVRPLVILTYREGAKGLPGVLAAHKFGAEARPLDAKANAVGISVAPPIGNDDSNRMDAVGGPPYENQLGWRQYFFPVAEQSYIYHHVVALTRALDYLETRPEVDVAKTTVMGGDWPGLAVALLHAIDDRPVSYFVWNGMGFYADLQGRSGDSSARVTREAYEMYAPAAYAEHGTKPIFIANGLNGSESTFDAFLAMARNLKSPKILAVSPNRDKADTAFREFGGSAAWQRYFVKPSGAAPEIGEGKLSVVGGKLRYSCPAKGQASLLALVSYGAPGNWVGRNWHRLTMKKEAAGYEVEIPVYDPTVPLYVIGQAQSVNFGTMANVPQSVDPSTVGIESPTATFPHELLAFTAGDDLYVPAAKANLGIDGPEGMPAGKLFPNWDRMVRLKNIEPRFWTGAKEITFYLKGDNTASPIALYFGVESGDELNTDTQNYTKVSIVPDGEILPNSWRKFTVPLANVADLNRVDSLFFETGIKSLQIAALSWR